MQRGPGGSEKDPPGLFILMQLKLTFLKAWAQNASMRRYFYPVTVLFLFSITLPWIGSVRAENPDVEKWVLQLIDPSLPDAKKSELGRKIVAQGKGAIPTLIQSVGDPRVIGEQFFQPGECINPPAHLPIPEHCKHPTIPLHLGERCEQLLYQILTPVYTSPHMTMLPAKDAPGPAFVIKDWQGWWSKNKYFSLSELHTQARKFIDQFWLRGYAQGPMEWN